jgi:hypothetical protein
MKAIPIWRWHCFPNTRFFFWHGSRLHVVRSIIMSFNLLNLISMAWCVQCRQVIIVRLRRSSSRANFSMDNIGRFHWPWHSISHHHCRRNLHYYQALSGQLSRICFRFQQLCGDQLNPCCKYESLLWKKPAKCILMEFM